MTANSKSSNRLIALDVMRGITVAGMILVNNPGSWGHIYAPLEHAEWLGLTPTDLVFPFFMFIMGVSTSMSLRKYDFRFSSGAFLKILRRAVLLVLIGWAVSWISRTWYRLQSGDYSFFDSIVNFENMRFLGVFPRLGICYFATATLALLLSRKWLKWVVAAILGVYTIMLFVGHGFEFSSDNIISVVDRAVLGERHMYTETVGDTELKFDPEGLLSTLPSIAHCIIGCLCGMMLLRVYDNTARSYNLFILGFVLTAAGFLLSYGCPISKKIWSPTFVFTTCGLASSLLAMLVWLIDIKGKNGSWCVYFRVFGINPLSLYVLSTLLAIAMIRIKAGYDSLTNISISLQGFFYQKLVILCCGDKTLASLIFALLFVMLNWGVGYILYKKKIIVKL